MDQPTRAPSSATDRDLVVAFKSGDGHAYDEIYRRHSPKIRVLCARRLSHSHDAEEAVQETFLRAYQALPRFNGQYKLGPWLNRIAINVCIDELRSRSRSEVVKPIEDHELEAEHGPEEMVSSRRPEVIAVLGELKPLHANALKLRAVHGLSHEELAQQLAISPNQVKSLLHRARLAFKRVMNDASGFVLAPLAILRGGRKHGQTVTVGGGAANVLGALSLTHSWPLVERLVTGAAVAALAIGSTAPALPDERTPVKPQIGVVATDADLQETPRLEAISRAADDQPATSAARARRAPRHTLEVADLAVELPVAEDPVTPITERVRQELEQHTNEKGNDAGGQDPPLDPDPVPADVDQAAAEARDTASDTAHEVLGDS